MQHSTALRSGLLALLFFALAACSALDDEGRARRGPLGKADSIGTCVDACGGQSVAGDCWCDDACHGFGDCCTDKVAVCGSAFDDAGGGGFADGGFLTDAGFPGDGGGLQDATVPDDADTTDGGFTLFPDGGFFP